MKATDSRRMTIEEAKRIYVTSEPQDSEWGQPPASQYVFTIEGTRLLGEPIAGIYLPSSPPEVPPIDSCLMEEFEAWELASDEALTNFEEALD